MTTKRRLSASVDGELLDAAEEAVSKGEAETVSAWVNDALERHRDHQRRMAALDLFIAEWEAEHGAISGAEIRDATRLAREKALVVRGQAERPAPRRPTKRSA